MKNIEITVIGPGKVNFGNTTVPANSTALVSWKPGLQLLPDTDVICTRILYNSKDVLTVNDIAKKATIFKIPTDIEKVLICFEKQEFAEVVFSINLEPGILKPPYDTMPDRVARSILPELCRLCDISMLADKQANYLSNLKPVSNLKLISLPIKVPVANMFNVCHAMIEGNSDILKIAKGFLKNSVCVLDTSTNTRVKSTGKIYTFARGESTNYISRNYMFVPDHTYEIAMQLNASHINTSIEGDIPKDMFMYRDRNGELHPITTKLKSTELNGMTLVVTKLYREIYIIKVKSNTWKYKGMVTSIVSTPRYTIIPGYTSVNSDLLEDGESSEYKVLKKPLTVIRLKTDILSKITIEGKSCDTPERLGETLYLSNVNVHTKEFVFENCRITPRKDLPLLALTYADHQLTTAKSLINTIALTYMNKLNRRYNLYLNSTEKLYFIELIQKINKHLYRIIGDLISPKIVSNCLPDINLEDKDYEYLYRPCPGKHFYYEVSKELNLIPDPSATELNSSSVISPKGQVIPLSAMLFGNVPGCRVEKLSEYSYQATITLPMPDSVKIEIRCENEATPPESIFFAQGESVDLRDIAEEITEEIDGLEYTFSQPNYLRDIQDPRDIPDPQDPEPSTEALLGDNLDQLMRYSRLSGYRGDHFVNN
jgi:hypothetical protein